MSSATVLRRIENATAADIEWVKARALGFSRLAQDFADRASLAERRLYRAQHKEALEAEIKRLQEILARDFSADL